MGLQEGETERLDQMKNIGRIEFEEESLCELLGYPGGAIKFLGWSYPRNRIAIVIAHPAMPKYRAGGEILEVEREDKDSQWAKLNGIAR